MSNVANSVTGFYKEAPPSDVASNMSRTQDNFASNLAGAGAMAMGLGTPNNFKFNGVKKGAQGGG